MEYYIYIKAKLKYIDITINIIDKRGMGGGE